MDRTLLLCLSLALSFSAVLCQNETDPDLSTTQGSPPTTLTPTIGPDDLTSTDYIIIGVTSAVACAVIVGGIVFCCCKAKEEEKEKEEMFNRYLYADQMQQAQQRGKTNRAFVA